MDNEPPPLSRPAYDLEDEIRKSVRQVHGLRCQSCGHYWEIQVPAHPEPLIDVFRHQFCPQCGEERWALVF